jgi:hypothetical protein
MGCSQIEMSRARKKKSKIAEVVKLSAGALGRCPWFVRQMLLLLHKLLLDSQHVVAAALLEEPAREDGVLVELHWPEVGHKETLQGQ